MKLFLITQEHNKGYDSYDSAVVAAPDEETAGKCTAQRPASEKLEGGIGMVQ